MQHRRTIFATNEIYHVFNRSVGRELIFTNHSQLRHILETVEFYRYPQTIRLSEYKNLNSEAREIYLFRLKHKIPLVELYVYAFMSNHYHFILKQTTDDGIRQFISLVQNSFAKYFNSKYDRHGSLFQSPYQGKWIENDEQFQHVSRYIHLNPVTSYSIPLEQLETYEFTSYSSYVGTITIPWINSTFLLGMFPSREAYKAFVEDQADYQQTIAKIKDLRME